MTRLLIIFAVAFVMTSAAIGWMLWAYQLDATIVDILVFWVSPVPQLLAVAIVVLSGFGAVAALKRNVGRVRMAAITAVVVGLLGAAYQELDTHFGTLYDSEITYATMAPGRLASLAILALGLFGAVLGLSILKLRGNARRN
ncbi:hypothetical protein [uncultured Brevundimonas sp.]|uniref:hypothetical protein n=1 Tax=uncultured Brevundimonas sp. TaxID=213418 RepID=UPI0025CFF687|nr:hypothetical protein [uncultured Brevundimonas sp.]